MGELDISRFILPHLGDILSFFLILAILSGRREARATLGWVIFVLFLPYLGAVAYLVFGRTQMSHDKSGKRVSMRQCAVAEGEIDPALIQSVKFTGVQPSRFSSLKLLDGAKEKYEHMFADIRSAKKRVVVFYYVFRRDRIGRKMLDLLAEKASQGIEVYLLYDGWGSFGLGRGGYLRRYRKAGLRIASFQPVADPLKMSRINFRNHRKIVVVDSRVGYTGSINIGEEYLGRHLKYGGWKDIHVRLSGDGVCELESVFRQDWESATGQPLLPLDAAPSSAPQNRVAQIIHSGPNLEDDKLYPLIFAQLTGARESIDILTPYLVPNQGLISALAVAAQKGVAVRVLVPGRSNHPMVAAAGRSHYEELLEHGVEIYETRKSMLHAKAIFVDHEWVMVGSANFDNRSFFLNYEINIATADKDFCSRAREIINGWTEEATPVSLAKMASRPIARRMFDSICRTLSPVL